MDWLHFISSVISSVAWPCAVVITVIALRRSISKVVESLTELNFQGFKAQFSKGLMKAEAEISQSERPEPLVLPASPPTQAPSGTEREQKKLGLYGIDPPIRELAEINPSSAVLAAWVKVEQELDNAFRRLGLRVYDVKQTGYQSAQIRSLQMNGYVDENFIATYRRLRDLRNRTAHSRVSDNELTYSDAMEYARLANRLVRILASLEKSDAA